MLDFEFSPPTVTIAAGGEVTWVNSGQAPHDATADENAFATDTIEPGDSGSVTIDEPGTYSYICTIHPQMQATVEVHGLEQRRRPLGPREALFLRGLGDGVRNAVVDLRVERVGTSSDASVSSAIARAAASFISRRDLAGARPRARRGRCRGSRGRC